MTYVVKEVFGPTLQGEGSLTGHPTWFVRMAGCNVWDGRPETKTKSACPYCDTDFVGGKRMHASDVLLRLRELGARRSDLITLSGGEPALQVDDVLVGALHSQGFRVAIETNGTRALPFDTAGVHVTCSPKAPRAHLALDRCDDLKLLYPHPHPALAPEHFADFACRARYLQPVNGATAIDDDNVRRTVRKLEELNAACPAGAPRWRLSVQLHKVIGVP